MGGGTRRKKNGQKENKERITWDITKKRKEKSRPTQKKKVTIKV